jgi:hypothetical protein
MIWLTPVSAEWKAIERIDPQMAQMLTADAFEHHVGPASGRRPQAG